MQNAWNSERGFFYMCALRVFPENTIFQCFLENTISHLVHFRDVPRTHFFENNPKIIYANSRTFLHSTAFPNHLHFGRGRGGFCFHFGRGSVSLQFGRGRRCRWCPRRRIPLNSGCHIAAYRRTQQNSNHSYYSHHCMKKFAVPFGPSAC